MEKPEALMDVEDLAVYLKLQKATIYNWLKRGKLKAFKIGRIWRFRKEDIDKWIEEISKRSEK